MSNEPVAYLWQHCETGRTRVVMTDQIVTTDDRWFLVGPLHLDPAPDDTALLRQALEALEAGDWYIDQLEMIVYSADDTGINGERAKVQAAITALRERLGEKV